MGDIDFDMRGEYRPRREGFRVRERAIAHLARRQHSVLARRQLTEFGLGTSAIDHRVAIGRLSVVHPGVYSIGPAPVSLRGSWSAAVLACGDDAVLSHWSAGGLWGLLASRRPVHVSAPRHRGPGPPGIAVHRPRHLPADERTVQDGIPVTSVPRTLLDLAAISGEAKLKRAVEEADRLQLLELEALRALRRRHRGRRGVRTLDRVLAALHEPGFSRSELEHRFVELCSTTGLPMPAMNVLAAGYLVDALWPAQRLVVELDGYEYHHSRSAIENDRAREAALTLAGYRTHRFSFRQVTDEPQVVAATIRAKLADYAARRPK